jgi:hypothetical protein
VLSQPFFIPMSALAAWLPEIGDPTVLGWTICIAYFATGALCAWAMRIAWIGWRTAQIHAGPERRARSRRRAYRASVAFWGLLIILFIILGVNKQVDMQTILTEAARDVARDQGWFQQRRIVQAGIVSVMGVVGFIVLAGMLIATRQIMPRHVLAFIGVCLLILFVCLRAVSFHHLDAILKQAYLGVKLRWMLEIIGILCVAACAATNGAWYRRYGSLFFRPAHTPLDASSDTLPAKPEHEHHDAAA